MGEHHIWYIATCEGSPRSQRRVVPETVHYHNIVFASMALQPTYQVRRITITQPRYIAPQQVVGSVSDSQRKSPDGATRHARIIRAVETGNMGLTAHSPAQHC